MLAPAKPANEDARMAALESFEVLDTLPQSAFDDIARLASTICGTPIALISLVDSERQWFKARVGITATHTSREVSFCGHAILDPMTVMVVEDATTDPRFSDNPLVRESPDVRFYAGAPIVTAAGLALGTVCVVDSAPRQLTPDQIDGLRTLSRAVMTLLEHDKRQRESYRQRERGLLGAMSQIESRVVERDTFLHMLSHDLRQPLNTIVNFSGILENECGDKLPETAIKNVRRIRKSGERMQALLDTLLGLVRLEQRQIVFLPVPLARVLSGVEDDLAAQLSPSAGCVESADLPVVAGDESLLRVVFQNLVSNAIKFAREGVPPLVKVTAARIDKGHEIRVCDNGIGMAADHLQNIFGEFVRLHSRKSYEGTGLGLSICRKIVQMHGGSITAASEVGRGSCFTLYLPYQTATALPHEKSITSVDRVILVDDDDDDNELHEIKLRQAGFSGEIVIIENGADALRYLETTDLDRPTLMFLDVNMPGMNGFEVAERAAPLLNNHRSFVLIILTSSGDPYDRARAGRLEIVNGFLTKPLDVRVVNELLTDMA